MPSFLISLEPSRGALQNAGWGAARRGHGLHELPKKGLVPPPGFEEQVVRAMRDDLTISPFAVTLARRGETVFLDANPTWK